ncbi:hypothetical protein ACP70R_031984 [Stipagrostis hirtigluma subsp. patula]
MAPPDQGSSGASASDCGHGGGEEHTHHERELSSSCSFSSPAASQSPSSSSASTNYLPASNKLSCDSIPSVVAPELANQSSFSDDSYDSFYHIEAPDHDNGGYLDFDPATRPPAVQTMRQQQADGCCAAAAYDPKRLPSSMFRTRSTSPAEWSVSSNESLFSIQLSSGHSGDLNTLYGDLYYDAAGIPRFPSLGRHAARLSSLSEASTSSGDAAASGGLCMREDCTRCSCAGGGRARKSVRFASMESVSGEVGHSAVRVPDAPEDGDAPAPGTTMAPEAAGGWCDWQCCWPSPTTSWWPRCCAWSCCDCRC